MFDSNVSDEILMEHYQNGDKGAFQELFRRHKMRVYNYIYRYTGNKEATEEIFQGVFIELHRAAPAYRPTVKFSTWLFTIVRNRCLETQRKEYLLNLVSRDNWKEGKPRALHDFLVSSKSPEGQSSEEISWILEEALSQLHEDQREVFLMRETAGLKFEEIAMVIGVSVNMVKSRMRHALENIKKYLEKNGV